MNVVLIVSAIIFIIINIFLVLTVVSIMMIIYTRVPYAPTPRRAIEKILDALKIQKGERVYDLGCGDGRFLFAAEKRGAQALGFENSLGIYLKSKILKIIKGSRAKIYFKNFYNANLSDADIIFCFLVDAVMPRIQKKLENELKSGARVVSYGFFLPTWEPECVILPDPVKDKTTSKIFIYKKA